MRLNKLTRSLTQFYPDTPTDLHAQASCVADHGGFTATLSAKDVVDDGNPHSIEVESRMANTPFDDPHDVSITVYITFDKAAEKSVGFTFPSSAPTGTAITVTDFDTYFFDENDERIDGTLTTDNSSIKENNKKNCHTDNWLQGYP